MQTVETTTSSPNRTNAVLAAGWISLNEQLPNAGQKVDLWLVPADEEKSYRISWTWEKESTAEIKISGCKVTHWMPFVAPPACR